MERRARLAFFCVLLLTAPAIAQAPSTGPSTPLGAGRPLPDLEVFLPEVRKHLQTDQSLQSSYTYVETRREQRLDKRGQPTRESIKVFESSPGLPGEQRWERLIAEDGRPVPAAELEKQNRERQKKAEEYVRRLSSRPEQERAKQAREGEKDRREMADLVDDVFRVYDVRMLGRSSMEGHDTLTFSLTPRAGAQPRTRDGKMMRHFIVQAWVSESDYELVRLEAEAIDTVSIGLGLLARIHKGARMSFQRRKINDEVWLPATFNFTGSARVGLVKIFRRSGTSEFSDYRKFSVETSTTIGR